MDKLRIEFRKFELECMHKQKDAILDCMNTNENEKKELQVYLERITANIDKLESQPYDGD